MSPTLLIVTLSLPLKALLPNQLSDATQALAPSLAHCKTTLPPTVAEGALAVRLTVGAEGAGPELVPTTVSERETGPAPLLHVRT